MGADRLARILSDAGRRTALALLIGSACSCTSPRAAPAFEADPRYTRQIEFAALDVTIPLAREGDYVRSDGAVDDVVAHTHELLEELGLGDTRITLSNPARYGRQMCITFENGDRCAFLWVQKDADSQIVRARLNHESFHALYELQPESMAMLDQRAEQLGYRLHLQSLDEELAATTVEVLTLYALGSEFVFGTGHVMQAVELLQRARISAR